MGSGWRRIIGVVVGTVLGYGLILPVAWGLLAGGLAGSAPVFHSLTRANALAGLVSGGLVVVVTWWIGRRPWDGVGAGAAAAAWSTVETMRYVLMLNGYVAARGYPEIASSPRVLMYAEWGPEAVGTIVGSVVAALLLARRQARRSRVAERQGTDDLVADEE